MSKANKLLITMNGITVPAGRTPYDRGYNFGYAAGLQEGARRERVALKRWADGNRQLGQSPYNAHVRSKSKPRESRK